MPTKAELEQQAADQAAKLAKLEAAAKRRRSSSRGGARKTKGKSWGHKLAGIGARQAAGYAAGAGLGALAATTDEKTVRWAQFGLMAASAAGEYYLDGQNEMLQGALNAAGMAAVGTLGYSHGLEMAKKALEAKQALQTKAAQAAAQEAAAQEAAKVQAQVQEELDRRWALIEPHNDAEQVLDEMRAAA